MSNMIGYARVSTTDQNCEIQEEALRAAGCTIIRSERVSGTSTKGRSELETVLDFIREGDALVVTRIDRLARSLFDLESIVRQLEEKGAKLKALEQPIDTGTASGRAFLQMLGVFAQFEASIRKERQMEGIAKAKAKGVYRGRKPSVDREAIIAMRERGMRPSAIAKQLKVGRTTVYRALGMVQE
jgi:DNA invertase Pin-like site-specific DNA recombinase